jgi:hypothetical protein
MLERLATKAEDIGERAATKARDRILASGAVPKGVRVEAVDGGIALSGKALRRRMITDPQLRNFGR